MLGATLLVWGALACLAWAFGGERQVIFSAVALGLCLIPSVATLVGAEWTFRKAPEHYLTMILGGTALRMVVVLAGGLALNNALPYFQSRAFWLWILALYLITLTLEVVFLVAGRASPGNP
jgi:hypothetical protein